MIVRIPLSVRWSALLAAVTFTCAWLLLARAPAYATSCPVCCGGSPLEPLACGCNQGVCCAENNKSQWIQVGPSCVTGATKSGGLCVGVCGR